MYSTETVEILVPVETQPATNMNAVCASFSPDDKLAACGNPDGTIKILNLEFGKILELQQTSAVKCIAFMRNRPFLMTGASNDILIWSLVTGAVIHSLTRHNDTSIVNQLIVSAEDNYFVSTGSDKQMIVWDAKELSSVTTFRAHCSMDATISIANDLSVVVYGPKDLSHIGILKPNPALVRALNGQLVQTVPSHLQSAQACALTFSSQKITARTSSACGIL